MQAWGTLYFDTTNHVLKLEVGINVIIDNLLVTMLVTLNLYWTSWKV